MRPSGRTGTVWAAGAANTLRRRDVMVIELDNDTVNRRLASIDAGGRYDAIIAPSWSRSAAVLAHRLGIPFVEAPTSTIDPDLEESIVDAPAALRPVLEVHPTEPTTGDPVIAFDEVRTAGSTSIDHDGVTDLLLPQGLEVRIAPRATGPEPAVPITVHGLDGGPVELEELGTITIRPATRAVVTVDGITRPSLTGSLQLRPAAEPLLQVVLGSPAHSL